MAMTVNATILDDNFEPMGESTLDDRKRVTLTKAVETLRTLFHEDDPTKIHFAVYINKAGQILLSPETVIPLHEAWLYKNRNALESVLRGMEQARRGELKKIGSFAQYADDEID